MNPNNQVTAIDGNESHFDSLAKLQSIKCIKEDLSNKENIANQIKGCDLAIVALPGHLGFNALKTCIESGTDVVDISFSKEDPANLNDIAIKNSVTAAIDCGVAPGLCHMWSGYLANQFDEIRSIKIYVGGLPQEKIPPYFYKAVFSPVDVIEVYTRPARIIVNKEALTTEALSDLETINFPDIGDLEAFNTDGLRTLLTNKLAPIIFEKTLRYPGHVQKIKELKSSGKLQDPNFQKELFKEWKFNLGDKDITAMRVYASGTVDDQKTTKTLEMVDYFDEKTKTSSMARTTGYTAAAVAEAILSDNIKEKGIIAPETLGLNESYFKYIEKYLNERGVIWSES